MSPIQSLTALTLLFCGLTALAFDADKLTQPTDLTATKDLSKLIYDINSRIKNRSDRLWGQSFRGADREETESGIRYWLTFHEKTQPETFEKYKKLTELSEQKQVESFLKIRKEKFESFPVTEDQETTIYGLSASDYYQEVNPFLWGLAHTLKIDTSASPWSLTKESAELIKRQDHGKYFLSEIEPVPPVLEALSRPKVNSARALYHGGRVRLSDIEKWAATTSDTDTYTNKVFASYSLDPSVGIHFISDTEKNDWVPALFVRRTTNGPIKTISEWSEYPEEMEILRLPEEMKVVAIRSLNDTCKKHGNEIKSKREIKLIYTDDIDSPKTELRNTTLIETDICLLYQ